MQNVLSRRLGILVSHPVQYYTPWFRHLAKRLTIEVFYAHRQDASAQARAGFGVEFDWDTPLLEGYPYRWLTNRARHPSVRTFNGCDTPELYHLLHAAQFDAFMVFGWNYKSAIQAIRACWQHNIPVLMRSDSQLQTPRSWLTSVVKFLPYRYFLPRLGTHLYVGQRNKDYLQHYGVAGDQLFFTPHFVDSTFFARHAEEAETAGLPLQMRSEFGIPHDAFVWLYVGKFIAKKRPADILRACLEVFSTPQGANVHVLIAGDGPLRTALELMARPHRQRIHFAGFRNQTQMPAVYRASNALILPSDGRETWGLVVNEAAACGVPALVSDAAGCGPDLIEPGRTGCTYPVGDIRALVRHMLALQKMCEDHPLTIRRALARKVARYSIERATEGLERALERSGCGIHV